MKPLHLTTHLRADADFYMPSPERILSGHPRQCVGIVLPDTGNGIVGGIWECEVGAYRINYGANEQEFCHILSGVVRLHDDDGHVAQFSAGDAFVVPGGFKGIWETVTPLRKSFLTTTDDSPSTITRGREDVVRFERPLRVSRRISGAVAGVPDSLIADTGRLYLWDQEVPRPLETSGQCLLGLARNGPLTIIHSGLHTSVPQGESFFIAAGCHVQIFGESNVELCFMSLGDDTAPDQHVLS
jgi:hypothetical protein